MFRKRMMNGKTRILTDIEDSNMLRLRALHYYERKAGKTQTKYFGDYLNEFLSHSIDLYATDIIDHGYNIEEDARELLNQLCDYTPTYFFDTDIRIEFDPEETSRVRTNAEEYCSNEIIESRNRGDSETLDVTTLLTNWVAEDCDEKLNAQFRRFGIL